MSRLAVIIMANRRMIAKTTIESDKFLDLPLSAQALYFHFCIEADDDGFIINPNRLLKLIGADKEARKALSDNGFTIEFDSGVLVLVHWRVNNSIRKERHTPTACQAELKQIETLDNNQYILKEENTTQPTTITPQSQSDEEYTPTYEEMCESMKHDPKNH